MAYSSTTAIQFVSNNNLQDAVTTNVITLNSGQTIPANNRFVTKQDALTYTNIDPTNTYIAAKTNSQIIAKRDITPLTSSGIVEVVITNNTEVTNTNIPGFTFTTTLTSSVSPIFGIHTAFTSVLSITTQATILGDVAKLTVNGTVIETIPIESEFSSLNEFASRAYAATDYIKIEIYNSL
jgi:hypothetical protein